MDRMMGNPAIHMMYMNALTNLSNGTVNAVDRQVLSDSPLPPGFIDPYAKQSMDALQTMELTFNALGVWIEEA